MKKKYIIEVLKRQILELRIKYQDERTSLRDQLNKITREIEALRDKIKVEGLCRPDETEKHYKKIHWEDAVN